MLCTKCNKDLPENSFYKRSGRNKRQKQVMPECKECFKSRIAESIRQRKLILVDKFGGECIECGYRKNKLILQFHHRNPSEKSFSVCSRLNIGFKRLLLECEKCDLLCPNCHAEKHTEPPD